MKVKSLFNHSYFSGLAACLQECQTLPGIFLGLTKEAYLVELPKILLDVCEVEVVGSKDFLENRIHHLYLIDVEEGRNGWTGGLPHQSATTS